MIIRFIVYSFPIRNYSLFFACRENLPRVCLLLCLTVRLEILLMAKIPEIIPVTDLRQDAATLLKRVQSSQQPLVIPSGAEPLRLY